MRDFNDYVKNEQGSNNKNSNNSNTSGDNIMRMVSSLAGKFDGKNQSDLIKAVYQEAKKGKKNGTLTNADLDNFSAMLSPMLDDKQRSMLFRIVNELKEI